jgi:hypothetical protein
MKFDVDGGVFRSNHVREERCACRVFREGFADSLPIGAREIIAVEVDHNSLTRRKNPVTLFVGHSSTMPYVRVESHSHRRYIERP